MVVVVVVVVVVFVVVISFCSISYRLCNIIAMF